MSDYIDDQYDHFDYRIRINKIMYDELIKRDPVDLFREYWTFIMFTLKPTKDDFYDDKKFEATMTDVSSNPVRHQIVKHLFYLLSCWDKRKTYEEALKKLGKEDWIGRDIEYVIPEYRSHEESMFETT